MSAESTPVDVIYFNALQLHAADERADYLSRVCRGNLELRDHVEHLLSLQPEAERYWNRVSNLGLAIADVDSAECPGTMVGPYKLLEQIGEGGMGLVFMAEQLQPVRRRVAVKIIKPGMDSRQVVARFEVERQALAMMDHPGIARVLDAGTTDRGLPYFVMELVRGTSITKYCRRHSLEIRSRLELFVRVCHTVQHAHQKGIIHRDLKPSNILVELHDVDPLPKIIDFGIAKAIEQPLTDRSVFTRLDEIIGTPLYMSPEQAELHALDVDTRSDVYSLGVLLYELLTEQLPFDRQRMNQAGYDELRRIIREEEPPRPSIRLSTHRARRDDTAAGAATLPPMSAALAKRVRGELDWIVMKSLEKDRQRRYQSAREMADDVQRFLNNQPVVARPPSVAYRTRKFAQRHTALLTTAAVVLSTLLLATLISLRLAWLAHDAQQRAEAWSQVVARVNNELRDQIQALAEAEKRNSELLYVAEMKLAADAAANGDIPRAASLLQQQQQRTALNVTDRFEWQMLRRQISPEPVWQSDLVGRVETSRISPDGRRIAVPTRSGQLWILDTATGQTQNTALVPLGLNSAAWSAAGDRVAAGTVEGSVLIYRFEPQSAADSAADSAAEDTVTESRLTLMFRLPPPAVPVPPPTDDFSSAVNDAVFVNDDQLLITAGEDGLIRLWDLKTRTQTDVLQGHSRPVEQLALSPDGTLLISAGSDNSVRIWNLNTRREQPSVIQGPFSGRVTSVAVSADGGRIAAGDIQGNVLVLDSDGAVIHEFRLLDGVESLVFAASPLRLLAGDRGGSLHLWSLTESDTAPRRRTSSAHSSRVQSLSMGSKNQHVFSGGRDGKLAAWSLQPAEASWRYSGSSVCAALSGHELLAADVNLAVLDLNQRRVTEFLPRTEDRDQPSERWQLVAKAAQAPRAVLGTTSEVVLLDTETRQQLACWPIADELHRLAISADGRWIAAVGYYSDRIRLWRPDDFEHPRWLPARQSRSLEFSPDGRLLAAGHLDDTLIYDLQADPTVPPLQLQGHESTLTDTAFSPDGARIATVSNDRYLKLWRIRDGSLLQSVPAHRGQVNSVSFDQQNFCLVTSGQDGSIRLWHADTLQPLLALVQPGEDPTQQAFLIDNGTRLVASTASNEILIYEPFGSRPDRTAVPLSPTDSADPSTAKAVFQGLGELPGGSVSSRSSGVSATGTIVVGHSRTTVGFDAFLWTPDAGLQRIGPPRPTLHNAEAAAVSDDGQVICGAARHRGLSNYVATRWAGPEQVSRLTDHVSFAAALSADGSVVVGRQRVDGHWTAFRHDSDGTRALPPIAGHNSSAACAITPDGSQILGTVFDLTQKDSHDFSASYAGWRNARIVLWDENGKPQIPDLDPQWNWEARGLSSDGLVITGTRFRPGDHLEAAASRGFVWRDGQLQILEPPPGWSHTVAVAISGDGQVVAGYVIGDWYGPPEQAAFVWDARRGTRLLNDVLARQGVALDWHLYTAQAINRDGTVIVGHARNPHHHSEAYRLQLPR